MKHNPVLIAKNPASGDDAYMQALNGHKNKRICEGAVEALQALEESPAYVLIADAALEEMQATELAEVIRDIDNEKKRFTYIIIVGDEIDDTIKNAFAEDVDAFVPRTDPVMMAAALTSALRISAQMNESADTNIALLRERDVLREGQLIDPLTGLGNRKLAEQAIATTIKQIESRGGAICLVMLQVGNYADVLESNDKRIANELLAAVGHRLQSLVRPMDTAAYWGDGIFVLILLQPSIEQCTAECYQRIFDGVRLKSYRTAIGYLSANIGMSICASHAERGPPSPERLQGNAASHLAEAVSKQKIIVEHLVDG